MTTPYQDSLDALTRVSAVQGAMLVTRSDALVVAESVMEDVDSTALAALVNSLVRRLEAATTAAAGGPPHFVHVQASGGTVLAAPVGPEMLLLVIGGRGLNIGRVRLEMTRVAEAAG